MAYYSSKKLASTTTLSYNKQYGGINIRFAQRLDDEQKASLRKLGYKYHNMEHYWYVWFSEENLAATKQWLKENLGMNVTDLGKKEATSLTKAASDYQTAHPRKTSAKKTERGAKQSVGKKSTSAVSQDGALQQMLATMDERMNAQDKRIDTMMSALEKTMMATNKLITTMTAGAGVTEAEES